jgi:choline monooxygenase
MDYGWDSVGEATNGRPHECKKLRRSLETYMWRTKDWLKSEVMSRMGVAGTIASGLPRAAYLDPDVLGLEVERWFARTWLFAGLAHEVPEAGDLVPIPYLRLFLVRDSASEIRAFHNVCRHRGHELVLSPQRGRHHIVCPYHAWTYDLTGALKSTSYFAGPKGGRVEGFDLSSFGLKPVRCARWLDWVFVNLDGRAPPLEDYLRPLQGRLGGVDLRTLRHLHDLEHGEVKANWKLVLENSLEPYHTPFVHPRTGAGIPLKDHFMICEDRMLGCAIEMGKQRASDRAKEIESPLVDGSIAADSYFFVIPPLFVFVFYANQVIIVHRNLPSLERPDRIWRTVHLYSLGQRSLEEAEIAEWRRLEYKIHVEEDGPVYESLQRGKMSPATDDGGVLSPVWEITIRSFYRQWAEALFHD